MAPTSKLSQSGSASLSLQFLSHQSLPKIIMSDPTHLQAQKHATSLNQSPDYETEASLAEEIDCN